MSIYVTLWKLKFPKCGEIYDDEWVEVRAQAVPPHVGSPTPECGYESGDPFGAFLPPPLETDEHGHHPYFRAVVFVVRGTPKGTERSAQEYVSPLLVVSGEEYATITFDELYDRISDALRGGRARVAAQWISSEGQVRLLREDGAVEDVDSSEGFEPANDG